VVVQSADDNTSCSREETRLAVEISSHFGTYRVARVNGVVLPARCNAERRNIAMETPSSPALTPNEQRLTRRCYSALKLLIPLHRRITTTQAMTFLHVAFEEGLSISTLATRCGVRPHTISKHLRAVGAQGVGGVVIKRIGPDRFDGADRLERSERHLPLDLSTAVVNRA
jgi:hypothetical protein